MIACDLFAALAIADWPKREWTVLAEVLLQQYGPQKRREAFVEPLMLEHLSGLNSKNVYRAIRNLKACNVIRDGSRGGLVFVKDYEQWYSDEIEKLTGSPCRARRLQGRELTFVASASERFGVPNVTKKPSKSITTSVSVGVPLDTNPDFKSIETSENVGVPLDTSGVQRDTQTNSFGCPVGHLAQGGKVSNGTPTDTDLADIYVDASPGESIDCDEPLVRDRRRAPGDLDLEKNLIHTQAGKEIAAPNLRNPGDLAELNEAIRFLGSYPNTEHIAQFLGQMHNTPDIIGINGWRWIVAAHRIAQRPNVRRLGFEYLKTIAVNATRADLDDIRSEATLIADTSGADTPAALQPARKLTAAERRKLDKEAWNLTGSQLKDEET